MRKAKPRRSSQAQNPATPADADGLDKLARAVDALATESAMRALDAAAKLAATGDPAAGSRVAEVAADVSAHTRRLEAEIGKVLLARRPL